jgi:filamentous hemagglutinin
LSKNPNKKLNYLALNSQIGDINILNSIDTSEEDIKEKNAKASVSVTVQNEYVEIGSAVKAALEAVKQLKQTKDDYSNYKSEVKNLENTLVNLKQSYKNKGKGERHFFYETISKRDRLYL